MARNRHGQTAPRVGIHSSKQTKTNKEKGNRRFDRCLSEILESRVFLSAGDGLHATYYDTTNLAGTSSTRVDPNINFSWGKGTTGFVTGKNYFSVRWRGQVQPRHSETYTFHTQTDDGVRLWIDGKPLIQNWGTGYKELSATIDLIAGQKYDLVMEYYENTGSANARLSWSSARQAREIVPQSQLYSSPAFPAAANVAATALSPSEIRLNWTDKAHMELGYRVERASDDGAFEQIANLPADSTSFTDTRLSEGSKYTYRVRAYEGGAAGAYSASVSATTLQTIPLAPTDLLASAISATQIDVAWSDRSFNEGGFRLQRSSNGGAFTDVAEVAAGVNSYADTTVAEATSYVYRVVAFNTAGASAEAVSSAVQTPVSLPIAPQDLTLRANGITVALNWIDKSFNEQGFSIERSTDGENFLEIATPSANVTTFVDRQLQEGTQYHYRVRAYNAAGASDFTPVGQIATGTQAPYAGSPVQVPGVIEAEHYDNGGEGVGYFDADAINVGGAMRGDEGVDLSVTSDDGGGANVGWTEQGEWLEYTIDVAAAGEYVLETRVASQGAGGTFRVLAGGNDLTAAVSIPDTGGWQNWQTLSTNVSLSAGQQVLRLAFESPGDSGSVGNVNWMRLSRRLPHVTGLVLINADTDTEIGPIVDGDVLDLSKLPTRNLNIRADVDGATESVVFNLDGTANIENHVPFALAGDSPNFDYRPWTPSVGAHELSVTPYARDGASGEAGPAVVVRFNVIDPPTIPAAPSSLTAAVHSSSQINLSWSDNSTNESGFVIERSADGTTWTEIGRVGADVTTYSATALAAATTYKFRVRSHNVAGASGESNVATATTREAAPPPVISEDFEKSAANFTVIDGGWGLMAGAYQIVLVDTVASTHINNRAVHKTGLTGDFSATVDATVPADAKDLWNDVNVIFGYQDPNNYYFFSSNQSNDHLTSGIFKVVNGVSTEIADVTAGISIAQTYKLRVDRVGDRINAYRDGTLVASAVDTTFKSGQVGLGTKNNAAIFDNFVVSGTAAPVTPPPPATAPAAPSGLAATATSSTQVDLAWVDNSSDATGFKVERSTDGGNTWTQIGDLAVNAKSHSVTGLNAATTYHFRVRAYNATGPSGYSNVAFATTAATDPATPLINESFAAGSAGNFTVIDGTWIADGAYRISKADATNTTHLNNRVIHRTKLTGDFSATVDAALPAGLGGGWNDFALIFGYQDSLNYYFFSGNESNDHLANGIFKVVNGVSTELADMATTVALGQIYKLRVDRVGNRIDAYRNGVLVASATDATFMTGQIGLGSKSNVASFDNLIVTGTAVPPPTTAPTAPTKLVATTTASNRIDLAWADNSSDEDGFKIERSDNGGSTWTQIATVSTNIKAMAVNGLTAVKEYFFRVRAHNVAGDSAYTNIASATTQPAPQVGDRPGPNNTGPTRPDLLKASGSITTTHDGQIIENLDITGEIMVRHNNVIIRNFRLNATGYYGIRINDTGANRADNVIIEDGEITGWAGTSAIYGPSCTIRRINFHHLWADAIKPWRYHVIEGNWIHHLGMGPEQHADGIQLSGCVDVIIRGNYIDVPDGLKEGGQQFLGNAAIFLNNAFGQSDNITIDGNWFNGGNYTIYSLSATNVRITNNFFGRTYNFGPKLIYGDVVWENNRWMDTGALFPM